MGIPLLSSPRSKTISSSGGGGRCARSSGSTLDPKKILENCGHDDNKNSKTQTRSLWNLAVWKPQRQVQPESNKNGKKAKVAPAKTTVKEEECTTPDADSRSTTPETSDVEVHRRVRFHGSDKNKVWIVSYQHDEVDIEGNEEKDNDYDEGSFQEKDVVSKSDLWWPRHKSHERRLADRLRVRTDQCAWSYLKKVQDLEDHTFAAVKIGWKYMKRAHVDVDISQGILEAIVEHLSAEDEDDGYDDFHYRGVEHGEESRHRERTRFMENCLLQQQIIADVNGSDTKQNQEEQLRCFCEQHSLKWRALARQWGEIDACTARCTHRNIEC